MKKNMEFQQQIRINDDNTKNEKNQNKFHLQKCRILKLG